jgi:hypothetical protein
MNLGMFQQLAIGQTAVKFLLTDKEIVPPINLTRPLFTGGDGDRTMQGGIQAQQLARYCGFSTA